MLSQVTGKGMGDIDGSAYASGWGSWNVSQVLGFWFWEFGFGGVGMCHTVTFRVFGFGEVGMCHRFWVFGFWYLFLESWNVSQVFGHQIKLLLNLNFAGKWSPWSHV